MESRMPTVRLSTHPRQVALLVWCFLCSLVSCEGSRDPLSDRQTGTAAEALISNQLHQRGTPGFVFLPPLVSSPGDRGDLVPDLPVMVRIDELTPERTTLRTLATFTSTSGPRGEHLRVHYQGGPYDPDDHDADLDPTGYYYVRWLTDDAYLTPSARYRVRVLVPARHDSPRELGFADVDVVRTTGLFRMVNAKQFVPLLNGTTLRIKFRIDWPAVDRDHDGVYDWQDNCPSVVNPDQVDSVLDGVGDACRCLPVRCVPTDDCHVPGVCEPTSGICTSPAASDGSPCHLHHARAICSNGTCQLEACRAGFSDCNGDLSDGCETAISTQTNCGGCGNACVAGPDARAVCRDGRCDFVCDRGRADCDGDATTGCEQDVLNDALNCRGCGRVCPDQQGCVHGRCTAAVCQSGYADCNSNRRDGCEANLDEDANHCGTCDACAELAHGHPACAHGTCVVGSCVEGYADCNGSAADGCESETAGDPLHCGSCGLACSAAHAVPSCTRGACAIAACEAGYANCDEDAANGCETELSSSASHCGACGHACVAPNATALCVASTCAIGRCNAGYSDCNGVAGDGCETNLWGDVSSCGACGNACPMGLHQLATTCSAAGCGTVCDAGYADCNDNPGDGCEAEAQETCGGCPGSNPCDRFPNAYGECIAGSCSFSACRPNWGDCDGVAANGCETDFTSVTSCGGCNVSCTLPPNATASCVNGSCETLCVPDYFDCNSDQTDGCEANVKSDPNNCGVCGSKCEPGAACSRYWCECPPNKVRCTDGPCTDLSSDPANCGFCGRVCAAPRTCSSRNCSCTSGQTYCSPGCADLTSDHSNCGGCGKACPAAATCEAGGCVCPASTTRCASACVDLSSDSANCGGCGFACPATATCQAGECVCPAPTILCGSACVDPSQCQSSCCHQGCLAEATYSVPYAWTECTADGIHDDQLCTGITKTQCRDWSGVATFVVTGGSTVGWTAALSGLPYLPGGDQLPITESTASGFTAQGTFNIFGGPYNVQFQVDCATGRATLNGSGNIVQGLHYCKPSGLADYFSFGGGYLFCAPCS